MGPDAVGADSEGCVQVALDDSVCAEPETCTDNFCEPGNANADSRNCVIQHLYSKCEDNYSCTLDQCVPGDIKADLVTGCKRTFRDDPCQDGATCSDNVCDPLNSSDLSGCYTTIYDERCADGNVCSDDTCVPGSNDADAITGCVYEANNALCDDGDECTGLNVLDQCADFESVPGDAVCPSFMVAAPLPDACSLDTVYFAVHVETTVDRAYCVTGVDGKQHCTTVGESATGWMKGNSTRDDKAWASYTSFSPCCCAGFSHVTTFLAEDSTVELLYATVVKASAAVPEEQLATVISELLNIP